MLALLRRYKEVILYLVFGVLTTVVSMVSFHYFANVLHINDLIANIISWIFAVSFAYITNKLFVFESKTKGISALIKEIVSFFSGRVATLLMEEVILYIGVNLLHINNMIVKLFAQVLVIVANYVISKLFVFKKK